MFIRVPSPHDIHRKICLYHAGNIIHPGSSGFAVLWINVGTNMEAQRQVADDRVAQELYPSRGDLVPDEDLNPQWRIAGHYGCILPGATLHESTKGDGHSALSCQDSASVMRFGDPTSSKLCIVVNIRVAIVRRKWPMSIERESHLTQL